MEERILLVLVIGVFYGLATVTAGPLYKDNEQPRPPYIDCVSSSECYKSHCCSVNQGRYSVPTCRQKPELGEPCRPGNSPISSNVTYPDNASVYLKDVYVILCPCQGQLTCSQFGVCIDPSEDSIFNYLHDMSD